MTALASTKKKMLTGLNRDGIEFEGNRHNGQADGHFLGNN